jgi:hypothetical protein
MCRSGPNKSIRIKICATDKNIWRGTPDLIIDNEEHIMTRNPTIQWFRKQASTIQWIEEKLEKIRKIFQRRSNKSNESQLIICEITDLIWATMGSRCLRIQVCSRSSSIPTGIWAQKVACKSSQPRSHSWTAPQAHSSRRAAAPGAPLLLELRGSVAPVPSVSGIWLVKI